MNKVLETLAVPWTRRWSGQVAATALVFWTVGFYAWLSRLPARQQTLCSAQDGSVLDLWCRTGQAGVAGRAIVVVLMGALVVGSALTATAATPRIVYLLAGSGGVHGGALGRVSGVATRRALRGQFERRRRAAAAGRPAPPRDGSTKLREVEKGAAEAALAGRIGQRAVAELRRYPRADHAMAPTRLGCSLAAMTERVEARHGLDLPVCWETLLAVLPPDARVRLAGESGRAMLRAQVLVWALLTPLWAPVLQGWVALALPVAAIVVAVLLYSGLRESFESYCDLVESLVALHRDRLYSGLGLAVPGSLAEERAAGRELSRYLAGWRFDQDAPLSWPEPAVPAPVTVSVTPGEGTS